MRRLRVLTASVFLAAVRRSVAMVIGAVVMLLVPAIPGVAASGSPGDLDSTFGHGGKVRVSLGRADSALSDAVRLSNDRILAAGYAKIGSSYDVAVARFTPNGKLDTSFGGGDGVATANFGAIDSAAALVVQPDGRIVTVGGVCGASSCNVGVARFRANGTLDPTFGTGGKRKINLGASENGVDVALRSDGKIVVGANTNLGGGAFHFAVARLRPNGTLDPTFGTGGIAKPGSDIYMSALALVSSGRIIVGGVSQTANDFGLERLKPNGQVDTTFGTGGTTTTDFDGGYDAIDAMLIGPGGTILGAGQSEQAGNLRVYALARYLPDGGLDPSFGSGGMVKTQFGTLHASVGALAFQQDGRILAAGFDRKTENNEQFSVARYESNGDLDTSFGQGGKVTTDITPKDDNATAVIIQSSGRIVLAGQAGTGGALARYIDH
jgi:uncharacterized delta-60 repeat protein